MKLSCETCSARYTIADDKVRGKIVKIRCRKCGAIVIATAPEEGVQVCAPATLTGERNEQSVLFSLSALGHGTPPEPTQPSEASGLIDIKMLAGAMQGRPQDERKPSDDIAHVSVGGVFAPIVAAEMPSAAPPNERRRGSGGWLVGVVVLLVALLVVMSVRLVRAPVVRVEPLVVAASSAPTLAETVPVAASASQELASAPPSRVVKAAPAASVVPRAEPSASAIPQAHVGPCCAGETETACQIRRSVGAACRQEEAPPFDAAAAGRALGSADLSACGKGGNPTGAGHALVTFQPSGVVSAVVVDTPALSGTATDRCVGQAYWRVKVKAFSGPELTVGKRFTVAP